MYDQTQTRVRVSGMLSAGDRFVLAKSERSALGSPIRAHDRSLPVCRRPSSAVSTYPSQSLESKHAGQTIGRNRDVSLARLAGGYAASEGRFGSAITNQRRSSRRPCGRSRRCTRASYAVHSAEPFRVAPSGAE